MDGIEYKENTADILLKRFEDVRDCMHNLTYHKVTMTFDRLEIDAICYYLKDLLAYYNQDDLK